MTKKEQVMDLWRKNFQDSEKFVRFYFEKKYNDEDSLVYEENGEALSALLMLPYPMTWSGTMLATSYISGACTMPKARNHGLMSRLLQNSFLEMNRRKIALSTLIPANDGLFQYYSRLGYTTVFCYSTVNYTVPPALPTPPDPPLPPVFSTGHFDAEFALRHYPFFRSEMMSKDCCVQHTEEDYLAVIEEAYLSGGRLLVCTSGNRQSTTGWALAVPESATLYVKELICRSGQQQSALLHRLFTVFHPQSVICRKSPGPSGPKIRHGMARITDAHHMLSHIAAQNPELSLRLNLYDPHIPANNGIFVITAGTCTHPLRRNQSADTETGTDTGTYLETDIPTLTRALLGYGQEQLPPPLNAPGGNRYPYMNLMME